MSFGRLWKLRNVLRFASPEMKKNFEEKNSCNVAQVTNFWCAFTFLLMFALLAGRCFRLQWFHAELVPWAVHCIPFAIVLAMLIINNCIPILKPHLKSCLCVVCLFHVGFLSWSVHFMVEKDMAKVRSLPHLWPYLELNNLAKQELETFLIREESLKQGWFSLVDMFLVLDVTHFLGMCWATTILYLSIPISLVITVYASPVIEKQIPEVLFASGLLALYYLCSSFRVAMLQRRQFELDYNLQESLARDAWAMQELAKQEAAHKEQSQQADTMLNHILKNVMADAMGCIHLYVSTLGTDTPADLRQAVVCLERGMGWCRKRQVLLRVTAGNYIPMLTHVHLPEFGQRLVCGRKVTCNFADQVVRLDPVLCDIVLDNALNNAFRHGNPVDPGVHFKMQLHQSPGQHANGSMWTLTFMVVNNAHPGRPHLTSDYVAKLCAGESGSSPVSALSEHLGLQHLFMAAATHGISLSLEQMDDKVTLKGVVDVELVTGCAKQSACTSQKDPPLPEGLHIVCLDDSAVARRLLVHILTNHTVRSTVQAFGADASDVDLFMHEALDADIAIIDNHLEYGEFSTLGVNILRELRHRGFKGFGCIRSANVSTENQQTYLCHGAQYAVGKDILPEDLIAGLCKAYAKFQMRHAMQLPDRQCPVVSEVDDSSGRPDTAECASNTTGITFELDRRHLLLTISDPYVSSSSFLSTDFL